MTVYVLTQNEHGPNAGWVVGVFSSDDKARDHAQRLAAKTSERTGGAFPAEWDEDGHLSNGVDYWAVKPFEVD